MKKVLLLIFIPFLLSGQDMSVKSFRFLDDDLEARVNHPEYDQNGEKCAIIKVVTSQKGFQWEGDALGIVDAPYKIGEYWLYVPHGAKTLTIKHEKLGVLRRYKYPISIKEACVYELVLTSNKVITIIEDYEEKTQWLVVVTDPINASVYLNDEYKGETVFQQEMPLGKYKYRIEHPLYKTETGIVELDEKDGKKEIQTILKPDFGSIALNSTPEGGAQVFLDGVDTGKRTPCVLKKVKNGKHIIFVKHKWFYPVEKTLVISNSTDVNENIAMQPNHGEVEIDADKSTSVYIDDSFVGYGKWKGRLLSGYHVFKLTKSKHKDAVVKKNILKGEKVNVNLSPQPRLGRLKIKTDPYDSNILLNGIDFGTTPKTIDNLLIGKYNMILSKEGRSSIRKKITIKEDETLLIDEKLEEGKVVVISNENNESKILIDGYFVGIAPVKTSVSFGVHDVGVVNKGESGIVKIQVVDRMSPRINISTKADKTINNGDRNFKLKKYNYSKMEYQSYLNLYPSGYRAKYAKKRVKKIDFITSQTSAMYICYHYDKVSQVSVGLGFLNTSGWSVYGTLKYGYGDMSSEFEELNMFLSGGFTHKIFYPLWINLGMGAGFRDIYNYNEDPWYKYSKFLVYPEVGLNLKLKNMMFFKYGIQYNNKDGGWMSQFGVGFVLDHSYL